MNTLLSKMKSFQAPLENIVFPAALLAWPLVGIFQGVSVMDPSYSLTNFAYPEGAGSTWYFATFLSNVIGRALYLLVPDGAMVWMNFACSLIVSVTALCAYYILGRMIPRWMIFAGEFIAVSLCWCPSVILYNTLTYCFLTLGSCFLFLAVSSVPEKKRWYLLAGFFLGLNVTVRLSNAVDAALILALWFWCAVTKKKASGWAGRTLLCIAGYAMGFGIPVLLSMAAFGPSAYLSMIPALFSSAGSVESYTLSSMILSCLSAYGSALRWFFIMGACTLMGMVWFSIPLFKKERWLKILLYLGGIAVLIRFFYGRGMFTVNYQDYWCMFSWAMEVLFLSFIGIVFGMAQPKVMQSGGSADEQFLSALCLVQILILPLGSNNYTFPLIGCLFVIAPYTIWMMRRLWQETRYKKEHFAWHAMVVAILCVTAFQGALFHVNFAFRDGTDGEKRSAVASVPARAAGLRTVPENEEALRNLGVALERLDLTGESAIVFGDAPGVHYLYELPVYGNHSWPDLDSYPTKSFERDLKEAREDHPLVILHEADPQSASSEEKKELLYGLLDEGDYQILYEDENWQLFW